MRYLIAMAVTVGLGWVTLQPAMADDCDADRIGVGVEPLVILQPQDDPILGCLLEALELSADQLGRFG